MINRDVQRPDESAGRSRRPLRRVRRAVGARRSLALIGMLVAVMLSLPALAVAAPSWIGPQHVSPAGSGAALVDVTANVAGTSIAAFENTTTATVQVSVRGPGDAIWPTPVDLSIAGQSALTPRIEMTSTGFAVAVWSRSDGADTRIQVSTRHATTGVWSAPIDISLVGGDATNPAVSLTEDMKAVVAWERSDGSNTRVQGSVYDPASGTWSTGVDLSAAGQDASLSAVARKPNGDAVALWLRSDGANDRVEASNYLAASATWSMSTELSAAGQSANNPQIASAPGGLTLAVWQRSDGANTIIQAAVQLAGATTWSASADISQPGQDATRPQVALFDNGDAVAVWQRSDGTNAIVQSSSRPGASGIWQPVDDLSASGQDGVRAKIATDAAGTATAVWRRTNGANEIAQAARRPAGGTWTGAINLSATGQDATETRVAADGEGGAIAAWQRSDGANLRIQAAAFDSAGPLFGDLKIPAKASVGTKASFSTTPSDRWGAPAGDPVWDFGDGETATGQSVQHTYKATGSYTVTLRQSDGIGNESVATQKLTVTTAGGTSCTIIGTSGNDVLIGTSGDDVICGLGGTDVLRGLAGADLLLGGGGDDQLFGGQGDDVLRGQAGSDRLVGKAGADLLQGGGANDRLNGNAGDDRLAGGAGDDNLRGGLGDDIARGKAGNDRLVGGPGDDRLFGQLGNDRIFGQSGADRMFGLAGDDVLVGGRGFDRASGGLGNDTCRAERRILC